MGKYTEPPLTISSLSWVLGVIDGSPTLKDDVRDECRRVLEQAVELLRSTLTVVIPENMTKDS